MKSPGTGINRRPTFAGRTKAARSGQRAPGARQANPGVKGAARAVCPTLGAGRQCRGSRPRQLRGRLPRRRSAGPAGAVSRRRLIGPGRRGPFVPFSGRGFIALRANFRARKEAPPAGGGSCAERDPRKSARLASFFVAERRSGRFLWARAEADLLRLSFGLVLEAALGSVLGVGGVG